MAPLCRSFWLPHHQCRRAAAAPCTRSLHPHPRVAVAVARCGLWGPRCAPLLHAACVLCPGHARARHVYCRSSGVTRWLCCARVVMCAYKHLRSCPRLSYAQGATRLREAGFPSDSTAASRTVPAGVVATAHPTKRSPPHRTRLPPRSGGLQRASSRVGGIRVASTAAEEPCCPGSAGCIHRGLGLNP